MQFYNWPNQLTSESDTIRNHGGVYQPQNQSECKRKSYFRIGFLRETQGDVE